VDGEANIQFLSGPSTLVFGGGIPSKLIEGHSVTPSNAVTDLGEETFENIVIPELILADAHILAKGIAHARRNPLHH